ncbi:MAG: long-chain fatty acid--CoA ligase, partial [Verrucomicrobia bacterium]|nr:long-chain fatty acid--CoA ligase [Verrucomicrobiota bacterium]
MKATHTEPSMSGDRYLNSKPTTLPHILFDRVKRYGNRVALRQKRYGIWNEISWKEYGESVCDVAAGLIDLGILPGDKVAVLSEDRLEWFYAELGIQTARATTVGIYPTDTKEQSSFIVGHSEARVWIVEDQEQFDKAMATRSKLLQLETIVVIDKKGLHDVEDPSVISFSELIQRGRDLREKRSELLEERLNDLNEDDIAIYAYTSGTTGDPKGAMIAHSSLVGVIRPAARAIEMQEGEEILCYLPLCHIAERVVSILLGMTYGATVNCIEESETLFENLQEVSPTLFFGFPRLWERLMAQIEIEIDDSSWIHRKFYRSALNIGYEYSRQVLAGEKVSAGLTLLKKVADWLVFWKLREKLGLRRMRFAGCGGAPVAPRVLEFFHAIGVKIQEGYGQTEVSGFCTVMPADQLKFGTIGKPLPGMDIRIADDGEILVRSPGNFQGYFKDPEKTAQALRGDWVHTGDVGEFDEEGFLKITGRIKDLIILSTGHNIAPQNLENLLKSSPY